MNTDLKMNVEMKELAGTYKDEITLLSRVQTHFYQCIGEFDFV